MLVFRPPCISQQRSLFGIVKSNTAGILLLSRYQVCRQKQQQTISPLPLSPPTLQPASSAGSSAWLIPTRWCVCVCVLLLLFFFKNPWEDLYSRWGPGRFFLNIYEPLDRGRAVLDCCPRCPLSVREQTPASNPHNASSPPPALRHTGDRGFKRPLGCHPPRVTAAPVQSAPKPTEGKLHWGKWILKKTLKKRAGQEKAEKTPLVCMDHMLDYGISKS